MYTSSNADEGIGDDDNEDDDDNDDDEEEEEDTRSSLTRFACCYSPLTQTYFLKVMHCNQHGHSVQKTFT